MTWVDYMAARQLLAEERVGSRLREQTASDDDEFSSALDAARRLG